MHTILTTCITVNQIFLQSVHLQRTVTVDVYLPTPLINIPNLPLLLINDGQDLPKFAFGDMLNQMIADEEMEPMIAIGIYCGTDRKNEYATACITDYKGRGTMAKAYTQFIFEELIPFLRSKYNLPNVREKAFAGFSLGALSALDIVWNKANEFDKVGCFSGSFWWRSASVLTNSYNEDKDRIMHQQVRAGKYAPWLQFYFMCGTKDETADRNGNGVIDSIDDTKDLINELVLKGYNANTSVTYSELEGGTHDVPTWGKAMPAFLRWGWGLKRYSDEAS